MKSLILRAIILALPGFFAWACTDAGADPSKDSNYVVSDDPLATETVALSFMTFDTQTACGQATGMRVVIGKGDETLTCVAEWAPGMISDPYTSDGDVGLHYVADCFFVVAPGTWNVLAVETLGDNLEPLPCCTSEFPATVTVTSGLTTEFGVEMQCQLVGPGALDIYGWLERPPIIKDLDIYPSKFGGPCVPRFFFAAAEDVDGDAFVYEWEVIASPGNGFKLWEHGPMAIFVGYSVGDYTLELTVTDVPHGMSTSLSFPIHVTQPTYSPKTNDRTSCLDNEPEVPAQYME